MVELMASFRTFVTHHSMVNHKCKFLVVAAQQADKFINWKQTFVVFMQLADE